VRKHKAVAESHLGHFHDLLLQCWEEGTIPQDMRDAKIVTLYKNKGVHSDCNYRGISLLSIVGKAYVRVVLNCLQVLSRVTLWVPGKAMNHRYGVFPQVPAGKLP
jgi:hypothetical protein